MKQRITKLSKYFLIVLVSIAMLLVFTTPALAIDEPDDIYIENVWAYQNCIEEDDQLYIVSWTIDYDTNPTEAASEAFYIIFYDSTDTALDNKQPYAYYNSGYAMGVASFYFTAADAPTWESACYIDLIGNPELSWSPAAPDETLTGANFTWQDNDINTTQKVITYRILELAQDLDQNWTSAPDSMIEYTTEGNFLSEYGAQYFMAVIGSDIISYVAYEAFNWRSIDLDYDRTDTVYDYTHDYAGDLEDTIEDTPFDLTDAADLFGTSRGIFTGTIYYAIVFFGLLGVSQKLQTTKPLMALTIPFVLLGAFIGVPLIVTILAGFAAMLATGYALFYKNTAT